MDICGRRHTTDVGILLARQHVGDHMYVRRARLVLVPGTP